MRVSFDLDDTLFVSPKKFKIEKPLPFPLNIFFKDKLRYGTLSLFRYLKDQNIDIWIYTTSYRSEKYIKILFFLYGFKIDNVINGYRHKKEVQGVRYEAMPSKCPNKYRINLHIDNDISVFQNGEIYGFKVFLIHKQDDNWVDKIISEIEKIKNSNN